MALAVLAALMVVLALLGTPPLPVAGSQGAGGGGGVGVGVE